MSFLEKDRVFGLQITGIRESDSTADCQSREEDWSSAQQEAEEEMRGPGFGLLLRCFTSKNVSPSRKEIQRMIA